MDPDEMAEEREQQAFVQVLLDREVIDNDASVGISRLYVDQGYQALSEKQKFVLNTYVLEANRVKACDLCSESIPWSEQIEALDSGNCGDCDHRWNKVMNED